MADPSSPADRAEEAEEASDEREHEAEHKAEHKGGEGRRRLRFAAHYPEDPALDALVDAFEAGDYARVREEGPTLAKSAEDPAVSRAARDLVSRLSPDPLAVRMLVGAGLLLAFLIYWFYSDHH